MKTLTIRIHNPAGEELAWLRMSSRSMFEKARPEKGGRHAAMLALPSEAAAELEALIDEAKQRAMTHEERVRGYMLMGYDEAWAAYLTATGFPRE